MLKNIPRVSAANSWNIFQHSQTNFVSPCGHVFSLYITKSNMIFLCLFWSPTAVFTMSQQWCMIWFTRGACSHFTWFVSRQVNKLFNFVEGGFTKFLFCSNLFPNWYYKTTLLGIEITFCILRVYLSTNAMKNTGNNTCDWFVLFTEGSFILFSPYPASRGPFWLTSGSAEIMQKVLPLIP